MQTLYIRADATQKIGTGHVMRCIALAQAWQDTEGKVVFISHCQSNLIKQRILDEGFNLVGIERFYSHFNDFKIFRNCISSVSKGKETLSRDWVVLDGYHFDTAYQKSIQEAGYKLLVIDDYAHLNCYHANLLLNQNINALDYGYTCDKDTILLLGADFILLRNEFLAYKKYRWGVPEKIKKILVTLGGADPDNITLKVIQAIDKFNDREFNVKIIVGPENTNSEELKKYLFSVSFSNELLDNVSNMPELMAWADLVISAAGSTCWELCFIGVPSLLIIAAENQSGIGIELDRCGAAINLGWHENVDKNKIYFALKEIINSASILKKMSEKGKKIVDGNGAKKVIFEVMKLSGIK